MKTKHDPRHIRRIKAIKDLFALSFYDGQKIESELATEVLEQKDKIDKIIEKCAPEWPLSQINRLDLNVLRLAVFEMLNRPDTPPKVIIDEAVELGKEFGSASSGAFINGVLASALFETKRNEEVEKAEREEAEKKAQEEAEKKDGDVEEKEETKEKKETKEEGEDEQQD